MYAKPVWYDTMRTFPADNSGGLDVKKLRAKPVEFVEEKMIKTLLRRIPILKLEWADSTDMYHVPIRQRFIERQLEVMEEHKYTKLAKLNEKDAFQQTKEEFQDIIEEFEQDMIDCRGDVIAKTRRGLAGFIKERDAFLKYARSS